MPTQFIISIGPNSESKEVLSELIDAGMDIARINFSHATPDEARERVTRIRELNHAKKCDVKILQDLCGPRLRIGHLPEEGQTLNLGDTITFYTLQAPDPKPEEIAINDAHLHLDLGIGNHILIEGGKFDCRVIDVDKERQRITTIVERGGLLIARKGINLPYVKLTTATPTEKDKDDIVLGRELGIEYVALSFVQSAKNITDVRALLDPNQKVFAKIEDPLGVAAADEIIAASDAIIIGRGDLAVEIPMEDVPLVQKEIIAKCNRAGKPVCVATQALMSMTTNPTPTRAEVSDVANAVLDGADILWLSDETTYGHYPVEATQTLVRIARRTEAHLAEQKTRSTASAGSSRPFQMAY